MKRQFDVLMHDHEDAIQIENYQAGYETILAAEQMLVKAVTGDPMLWAIVLDKKRHTTDELEMWAENIDCCRAAIDRLGKQTLWTYCSSDDVI